MLNNFVEYYCWILTKLKIHLFIFSMVFLDLFYLLECNWKGFLGFADVPSFIYIYIFPPFCLIIFYSCNNICYMHFFSYIFISFFVD